MSNHTLARTLSRFSCINVFDNTQGEAIRQICKYCKLDLVDYRFKSRDEFVKMKPDLAFGQVPALEVTKNGKTSWLFQSASILRFLAKISGKDSLYPKDPIIAAHVDMICDQEADAFQGFRVARYKDRFGFSSETVLTPDVEKNVKATINRDIIPRHLGYMERLLKSGGTGYLAGTKEPTIADFFWYPTFVAVADGWTGNPKALDSFPLIQSFMVKFKALDDALRESN